MKCWTHRNATAAGTVSSVLNHPDGKLAEMSMTNPLTLTAFSPPSGGSLGVDFTYLFGLGRSADRHDPHIHRPAKSQPLDLVKLSEAVRLREDRKPQPA